MGIISGPGISEGVRKRQPAVTKAGIPSANEFNGEVDKGDLCMDTTNNDLYVNIGTRAATSWQIVGVQT